MQAERLNPGTLKSDSIVRSAEKLAEGGITRLPARKGLKVTESILNEQVVLQAQDPKMNGVYKSSLIDLEAYGVS